MFNIKYNFKNFQILILILIINSSYNQRLSKDILGGWNEKELTEQNEDYILSLKSAETYLLEQGYSLDETDIIPFGFFKQIVNGINYRILCVVKEKSSNSPTIYDINFHKNNDEIKMIHAENPGESEGNLTAKEKKQIETAIIKYYFEKLYTIKEWDIQYEYHNLNGLNDYKIYDITVELGNKNENFNKRVLIVYRNDKTFKVEMELNEE